MALAAVGAVTSTATTVVTSTAYVAAAAVAIPFGGGKSEAVAPEPDRNATANVPRRGSTMFGGARHSLGMLRRASNVQIHATASSQATAGAAASLGGLLGGGKAKGGLAGLLKKSARQKPEDGSLARKRWHNALSTIRAFQIPAGGLHHMRRSIRPQTDAALLSNASFVKLAPLLSPVLRMKIPDNDTTAGLSGEARLAQTIKVMLHVLITKLGGARVALVIEDAHWLDSCSWKLMAAAVQEIHPLFAVITRRTPATEAAPVAQVAPAAPVADEAESAREAKTLYLEGLGKEEVGGLLRSALRVGEVPSCVSNLIMARGRGSPLWTLELARSMLDSKVICAVDGSIKLLKGVSHHPPAHMYEAAETIHMYSRDHMYI